MMPCRPAMTFCSIVGHARRQTAGRRGPSTIDRSNCFRGAAGPGMGSERASLLRGFAAEGEVGRPASMFVTVHDDQARLLERLDDARTAARVLTQLDMDLAQLATLQHFAAAL